MKRNSQKSTRQRISSTESRKSGVTIIGAGRLGTALGVALHSAGYDIKLVVTSHPGSARRAARAIGLDVAGISADQLNSISSRHASLLSESSLILIATPDDIIRTIARTVAQFFDQNPKILNHRRTVLHTSGALSAAELNPLKRPGIAVGSLHPLVAISHGRPSEHTFEDSFFCVEGDPRAVRVAAAIVRDLGATHFTLDSYYKPLYHAAAVMAAGNSVALFDIAVSMLRVSGLSARTARQVLLPLIKSSIRNLEKMETAEALTGPVARGDARTVRKHLTAMKSQHLDLAVEVYRALGRQSLNILSAGRKRPKNFKQVAKLF